MSTSTATSAVLARTSALAAERGLRDVLHFVEALPDGRDRAMLLLAAPGVDTEPLHRWIPRQDGTTPVRTGLLELTSPDAAAPLTANRVVAVLQCGTLLLPDTVEAAAAVVHRPAGTFAVVLVGAEVVQSAEDLELVQRGIWRVLIGDPGVEWFGQDLAEHGCVLWSDRTVADFIAGHVAKDMERLRQWIRGGVAGYDPLAEMRVWYALDLAERELARRTTAELEPPRAGPGNVSGLRAAAEDLRRRLLRRLDADLAAVELQIAASLQMLEQDLIMGIEEHLDQYGSESMNGSALAAAVSAYLTEGSRDWRDKALELVVTRLRRTSDETGDLLDGVDWVQVNTAVGESARGSYPMVILDRLTPRTPLAVPEPDALTGPAPPTREGPAWAPTLRRAAYGAVAAAASLAVLGPELLPVVAAGAIGAAGGAVVDVKVSEFRGRRAAVSYARAAIAATMDEFARTVREQVRQSTAPVRRAVGAEFKELDASLRVAVEQLAIEGQAATRETGPGADAALLAELRGQLSVGTSDATRGG